MKKLISVFDESLKKTILGQTLQLIQLSIIGKINQMTILRVAYIRADDEATLFALFMRVHT